MRKLFIALYVSVLFVSYKIYSIDTLYSESEILYKRAVDASLSAWTQLDLLASTRTAYENYYYFGKTIVEQLLDLRMFLLFLYNLPSRQELSESDQQYLWSLVHQVYERLTEVKENYAHPQILCAQIIAEHIIEMNIVEG